MGSGPDHHSPLSGLKLVQKKVRLLCLMGGMFTRPAGPEYNVVNDPGAAAEVFAHWPTELVVSGFEIGNALPYPAASIEADFNYVRDHPIRYSCQTFAPMPYDRPTWDLTAVLHAVNPQAGLFELSHPGVITLDANAVTQFSVGPLGAHRYLILPDSSIPDITELMVELVSRPPDSVEALR